MSCVRCEPVRSPPGRWPICGPSAIWGVGIVRRDVSDASRRHPAAPSRPGTQTRCSRALGSKDFTPACPAAAFNTDRADPEFRLRRRLRHQRPSPTAATIRSDSNGSRARHEVLSEYKVLGRASGAADADGGASPHVRSTPRCEIQARSRELTGDHLNVI